MTPLRCRSRKRTCSSAATDILEAVTTDFSENPNLPPCPECGGEYTYEMDPFLVCPECGHEWTRAVPGEMPAAREVRDAVGNVLVDGDSVTVIKTLKVKGSAQPIKTGTKVRNIRLIDTTDDHDIDCRIDGFGPMKLKSSVVKKA